jgi:hypothetical protein
MLSCTVASQLISKNTVYPQPIDKWQLRVQVRLTYFNWLPSISNHKILMIKFTKLANYCFALSTIFELYSSCSNIVYPGSNKQQPANAPVALKPVFVR